MRHKILHHVPLLFSGSSTSKTSLKTITFGVFLLATILLEQPTHAAIVSVSGDIMQIEPPESVVANGTLESNNTIFLFKEMSDITLPTDLTVDAMIPGTYGPNAHASNFPQGSISSGTPLDSYFIHSDPVGKPSGVSFSGNVTFDQDILGVMFTTDSLQATHVLLGAPGTIYDDSFFNIFTGGDQFTISANRRVLTLNPRTASGADHLRILTAVPIPSALLLFGTGFVGLANASIRRKWA